MSTATDVQFRCPICESPRFTPLLWVSQPPGSTSALYECASCSFTFTDPLRFARERAALRTRAPLDSGSAAAVAARIPRDRRMVNLDDDDEVHYWCTQFQCSERRLRDVVTHVGMLADDIKGCISRREPLRRRP